jgi:hypothetical protein
MLLAVDFDEDLIDVESIAIAPMLPLQSSAVESAELDTPETDCFSADGDTSFCEEIFDISMAEIEAVVEPDGITDDVGRESVPFCRYSSTDSINIGALTWRHPWTGSRLVKKRFTGDLNGPYPRPAPSSWKYCPADSSRGKSPARGRELSKLSPESFP